MPYKTINIKPETYERLLFYRHGTQTFDEAINGILDEVDPEEFYRAHLNEHLNLLREMDAGGFTPLADLRRKHGRD